ncbi:EamA family transporter [Halobacterium sp. R2-5]|uniref:EamA family transporter n=1 Tax=Halobacterium sp. R2-5 TaxID=2715751 RepID=UPI0014216960|nr:EamA family transporter [Halobacterium sp. R2-5]
MNAPLGIALAVAGAAGWALQYVAVRLATDHDEGSVAAAMVVALATNVVVVVPAAAVWFYPDYGLTPLAVGSFAAAGFAGSLVARVAQFASTTAIGASRTAPVVSTAALFSAVFAVAFLGETLTPVHAAGIVFVVVGVAVVSYDTARGGDEVGFREAGAALVLPLVSALALGVEPVFVKTGLAEGPSPFVGLAVMSTAATIGYGAYARATHAVTLPDVRAGPVRLYVVCGLGSTLALAGYFAALALLPVVVVVPIFQTAPLLVLAFSALVIPQRLERVTPRLVAAAAVVVVGTTIVSLST